MGQIDAEILLAQPRGFCAGVDRAIQIVEEAIAQFGKPIFVRHQIIHNARVIEDLTAKGAIFIEELDEVPEGATLIFSAHGVSAQIRQEANQRGFRIFDATCPLVNKVHVEVLKFHKEGIKILMIGHAGHPEVMGTMGQVESGIYLVESVKDVEYLRLLNTERIAFVTQTTLSVDETQEIIQALIEKYPNIIQPKKQDICYATQNRQDAVKVMVPLIDMMVVVGSANSSNSNRLKELAARLGVTSYLVDHPNQLSPEWFVDKKRIGITAGASAPEALTQQIIQQIKSYGSRVVKTLPGIEETTIFSMPKGLVS